MTTKIIYRISTGLLALLVGTGSIADLFKVDAVKKSFIEIGFPEYMLIFFGTVKLAGVLAILFKPAQWLKEWAYAGIIFYFAGASYIHLTLRDGFGKTGVTLFILFLAVVSYMYSKKLPQVSYMRKW